MQPQDPAFRSRHLLAIALASFAVLFFQIAITRVLSVVLWYHWAFLSISLAMLGLGAPGVWFALRRPGPRLLPTTLLLGGLAIPGAVAAVLAIGNGFGAWSIVLCLLCLLVPMLLLGAAVCLLLLFAPGASVGRMYGADLLGAALASALVLPALMNVPTPQATALVGLLPIGAALLVGGTSLRVAIAAALLIAFVAWGEPLRVRRTKGDYDETTLPLIHERWTPTARLTFFDRAFGGQAGFGWGFGTKAPKVPVHQYWMEQDGSAGTPITQFDGDVQDLSEFDYLFYDVTSVAYQVTPPRRVAVIGGGGGRDVLTALCAKASHIDAVELNPGVVETISTQFKAFAGDIYHAPGVHATVSEGRSFLTRATGNYDLIQISLIDSWAATAAGAYTLAENNLYTVEAYKLYLERLAPGGVISTSRWIITGMELYRLLFLTEQALRESGVTDPHAHMLVVRGGQVGTVVVGKAPFTAEQHARAKAVCEERGFDLLWPGEAKAAMPPDVPTLLKSGPGPLLQYGLYMEPPTDDRPFFFQSLPVLGWFDTEFARQIGANAMSVRALQLLVLTLGGVTLALFFLPFTLRRWLPGGPGFWRGSGYFAAIGIAFMLIEIPWLQRFVLYVGHPSVAAAAVIGSLLLGAGVGSLRSATRGLERQQRLWWLTPLCLAALNLALPTLFAATLGYPEAARIAITAVLLAGVGYLLGQFFPTGMQRFGDANKAWYWALNGACGVLASVCSLALAMAFGFTAVAWVGVAGYLLAGILLRGHRA